MYRHATEPPPTEERTMFGKCLAFFEKLASAVAQMFGAANRRV